MLSKVRKIYQNVQNKNATQGTDSKVILSTARSDFDNKDTVIKFFRDHGIPIDEGIHLHRAGNIPGRESPAEKKNFILQSKYLTPGHNFKSVHFPIHLITLNNESLITRARNSLISEAMTYPKVTHMVFIDSDISWNPEDLLKLVLHDKPIVGGIYPKKKFHWDRLLPQEGTNTNVINSWIKSKGSSPICKHMSISNTDLIQNKLVDCNLNFLDESIDKKNIYIDNNLIKVKHIATGFMMLQRNVIQKMIEAYPLTKYVIDNMDIDTEKYEKFSYALFDCGIVDGHYLSEDWFFCDRWTKIGGSIYADIMINLTHTGIVNYKGNTLVSLVL
jgi:hypothetical protein